jgi:hypothetical protein
VLLSVTGFAPNQRVAGGITLYRRQLIHRTKQFPSAARFPLDVICIRTGFDLQVSADITKRRELPVATP